MYPTDPIICEHCREPITDSDLKHAVLTWLQPRPDGNTFGYAVTHGICSWCRMPLATDTMDAVPHESPLGYYTGPEGFNRLVSIIRSGNMKDIAEGCRLIERLHGVRIAHEIIFGW